MFENVLGQPAADQLIQDIKAGLLAPAMLFSGPPASGKGTAALELARIVSCESLSPDGSGASWNCPCPACAHHRFLTHPDLLCLGPRPFIAEISASAGAFLRDALSPPSRVLFTRSVRKLLARFNPVLWEDDPKGGKLSPLVNSLEEDLDELELLASGAEGGTTPEKLTEGIIKNAIKLESEGLSDAIPIAQIRKAAWWSRLAPSGRGKFLLIENADRMQEEARNSLLKLLEEPPPRLRIVLSSARSGALLPTMLSRLRPYRFTSRDEATQGEVIRRVFRDAEYHIPDNVRRENMINEYLDSFLPVSGAALEALAAFFAASAAYKAALLSKKMGRAIPEEVVLLGKSSAPLAEAAGLGRPSADSAAVVAKVIERADGFQIRSLFSRFLKATLEQVSTANKGEAFSFLPGLTYNELWKKKSSWAESAVGVYNLRPAQAMEKLFSDLSRGMSEL